MEFSNLPVPSCKKFTGYKPCLSYTECLEKGCQQDTPENRMGTKILIISLDALGAVLYNTSILPAIKRKYPESTIYWITLANAEKLLFNNPLIDRVFVWSDENRMVLKQMLFDYVLNADKSEFACAFAGEISAKRKCGFMLNSEGKIVPSNEGAMYNYVLGNSDQVKFRDNKRTGSDILHETFELDFKRDEYVFEFTNEEKQFIKDYKNHIRYDASKYYIGFNTGCSLLYPNKKMTVEQHCHIIEQLCKDNDVRILLFGGREDIQRNDAIYAALSQNAQDKTINTPADGGIRKGIAYIDLAKTVITGDSFGMHASIALKKNIIVWFGMSCVEEIEIYDRGIKLYPKDLECAPCWKKKCPNNLECIEMIDLDKIISTALELK